MSNRSNSLKELMLLQRRMNKLFDTMIQPEGASPPEGSLSWIPSSDVYEDADHFYVEVELPGVCIEDVDVTVKNSVLRVSGQRKPTPDLPGKGVQRMERYFGPFLREFSFPDSVESSKVEASLSDGLLLLKVPRKRSQRSIEIT